MNDEQALVAVRKFAAELESLKITLIPYIDTESEILIHSETCEERDHILNCRINFEGWPKCTDGGKFDPYIFLSPDLDAEDFEKKFNIFFGRTVLKSLELTPDDLLPSKSGSFKQRVLTVLQDHLQQTKQMFRVRLADTIEGAAHDLQGSYQLLDKVQKKYSQVPGRPLPSIRDGIQAWAPPLAATNRNGTLELWMDDGRLMHLVPNDSVERIVAAAEGAA